MCKNWKRTSFIPKRLKSSQNFENTCLLIYGCHGNGEDVIILIMISNDLQSESRKSHQSWRKTDKNCRSGEQIYGRMCPLGLYRVNVYANQFSITHSDSQRLTCGPILTKLPIKVRSTLTHGCPARSLYTCPAILTYTWCARIWRGETNKRRRLNKI